MLMLKSLAEIKRLHRNHSLLMVMICSIIYGVDIAVYYSGNTEIHYDGLACSK